MNKNYVGEFSSRNLSGLEIRDFNGFYISEGVQTELIEPTDLFT